MVNQHILSGILLVSLVAACSKEAPPPATPIAGNSDVAQAGQANAVAPQASANSANIRISDRIREACGLQDTEAYFSFDSAKISKNADQVLSALARCFTTGPLKGESMRLVGHADPRGDSEYNLVLGGQRADEVSSYLGRKGVALAKRSTSSRGEMDASGADESGWSKDRRVDVMLAE